jgi:hypothetical protein
LGEVFFSGIIPNINHETRKGGHAIEIHMCNMLVSGLCGKKSGLAARQDLAVAHRLVSGLEGIPKRIGRARQGRDILTKSSV